MKLRAIIGLCAALALGCGGDNGAKSAADGGPSAGDQGQTDLPTTTPDAQIAPDLGPPLPAGELLYGHNSEGEAVFELGVIGLDGSDEQALPLENQVLVDIDRLDADRFRNRQGPYDLYVADYSSIVRLPGGRTLFQTWEDLEGPNNRRRLLLFDGERPQVVARVVESNNSFYGNTLAVTRDGARAFWPGDHGLSIVRTDGSRWPNGAFTKRIDVPGSRGVQLVHLNAKWVYFVVQLAEYSELYRASLDGSDVAEIELPHAQNEVGRAVSSADGSVTAIEGITSFGGHVLVIDEAGTRAVGVGGVGKITTLAISPSGQRIAYGKGDATLYVIASDGSNEQPVGADGALDEDVDLFSHASLLDDETLVFAAGSSDGIDLYRFDIASSQLEDLTESDRGFDVQERFEADGNVFYILWDNGLFCASGCYEFVAVRGSDKRMVAVKADAEFYPRNFTRLADGNVIFVSGEEAIVAEVSDLYVFDPKDPQPATNITNNSAWELSRGISTPRVSPDGKHIAYLSSSGWDNHDMATLWIMPVDGGEAREIEGGKAYLTLLWRQDSQGLVFAAMEEGQWPDYDLYHLPLSATQPQRVVDSPGMSVLFGAR